MLSFISTREFLRTREKCREARAEGECFSHFSSVCARSFWWHRLRALIWYKTLIVTPKKNHGWYFLMFAINWIYWNLELLQHVNMKQNNIFYWYIKNFQSFDYLLASLCIIFQPNHFPQLEKNITKKLIWGWKICGMHAMFEMTCP